MARAVEYFGALHVLFNCAGGSVPEDSVVTEVDMSVWDRAIPLDLKGPFLCSRFGIPKIIDSGGGAVVNVSSVVALRGNHPAHVYSAAKGGVISFSKSIAKEVGRHNINVNVLSPGATNSPMRIGLQEGLKEKLGEERWLAREEKVKRLYPLRRIGEMEDISNTAMFLTSDVARHITGQVLSVNGGFAMVG